MESAVYDQLQKYLLENYLISCRQCGFRSAHGMADFLNILSQKWNQHLDNGEEVVVISLDIKGAFDKMWYNGLLSKLKAKRLRTRLLTWINSYLSGSSICVMFQGRILTLHQLMHLSPKALF